MSATGDAATDEEEKVYVKLVSAEGKSRKFC